MGRLAPALRSRSREATCCRYTKRGRRTFEPAAVSRSWTGSSSSLLLTRWIIESGITESEKFNKNHKK